MELQAIIDHAHAGLGNAQAALNEGSEEKAAIELQRTVSMIQDTLKPPEEPAEETDQAQKQDSVASS
jgi:hypothetical protein